MEPTESVPWWYLGEAATFRYSGSQLPPGMVAIEGVVADSGGREVGRVALTVSELQKTGWSWRTTEPGFYEVVFYGVDASGSRRPLGRTYHVEAPNHVAKDFVRDVQGFAVTPRPSPATANQGQFGFDTYAATPNDLMLAKLIGFEVVRLTAHWGQDPMTENGVIEPVKGEFHWEEFDREVNLFSNAGFVINAQLFATPRWATTHPEKAGIINICVDEASTYAPQNMEDWSTFVRMIAARYKDRVHLWEMWDEPSIPGGSVFWSDSTENYVKLLQAGYDSVKSVQPDGEVWLGGLGPRPPYHEFFDKVLQLGGAKYFDVLSLHGIGNTPAEQYRSIEIRNHVRPKPAVSGEWHAILQGSMQGGRYLSEQALSLRMMTDLMHQISEGASRTLFFELINLNEVETLKFSSENKWFTHSSGLFRRLPQLEPRLPAVVMSNFLDISGRKASYRNSFSVDGDIKAVELSTAKGELLAFWSDTGMFKTDRIKAYVSANSSLTDWEGKSLSLDRTEALEEKKLYYLTSPNKVATDAIKPENVFVQVHSDDSSITHVPHARLSVGELFGQHGVGLDVPTGTWIDSGWKATKLMDGTIAKGFSARAAVGVHPEGLDLVVKVRDKTHVQHETAPNFWNGDSLQVGIDSEGNGNIGGSTEILAALTAKGPVMWKIHAADPHGDIPSRWSSADGPVKYAETNIGRHGYVTTYTIRIPWSELYPLAFDPAKPLRISLLVNDNDGKGREAYVEWGQGIGVAKDPSLYGVLQKSTQQEPGGASK